MSWLRRRRRSQRGAVAVEAALLTPILLTLVLGIIEFSFVMRDSSVVVSDSRSGARIASTGAKAGACDPQAPPCTPANEPALAQLAADAIQRQGSAMPVDNIQYILVYKANAAGYPSTLANPATDTATTMPTSCSGYQNCVRFTWQAASNKFKYADGAWNSTTINACFPGNLDRVGVQVVAIHKMLFGLFGKQVTLSDHAVMDFEPLDTAHCASGQHV